jgi:hypothetical protein
MHASVVQCATFVRPQRVSDVSGDARSPMLVLISLWIEGLIVSLPARPKCHRAVLGSAWMHVLVAIEILNIEPVH